MGSLLGSLEGETLPEGSLLCSNVGTIERDGELEGTGVGLEVGGDVGVPVGN